MEDANLNSNYHYVETLIFYNARRQDFINIKAGSAQVSKLKVILKPVL